MAPLIRGGVSFQDCVGFGVVTAAVDECQRHGEDGDTDGDLFAKTILGLGDFGCFRHGGIE